MLRDSRRLCGCAQRLDYLGVLQSLAKHDRRIMLPHKRFPPPPAPRPGNGRNETRGLRSTFLRTVGWTLSGFVIGDELAPRLINNLAEGRDTRVAGTVDG